MAATGDGMDVAEMNAAGMSTKMQERSSGNGRRKKEGMELMLILGEMAIDGGGASSTQEVSVADAMCAEDDRSRAKG